MALTKAPLFGLDASGTIADALVFSKWKGRTYVRRHAIPSNPKSGTQVGMRAVFKFITQYFVDLTAPELAIWEAAAAAGNYTALNALVKDAQGRARLNLGWRVDTGTIETTIDPPTTPTATALPKALRLAWVRPIANQGTLSTAIWQSLTGTFTRSISNLVRVLPIGPLTIDITGLTTGVAYFFEVAETGKNGLIGTSSAEATGTPD